MLVLTVYFSSALFATVNLTANSKLLHGHSSIWNTPNFPNLPLHEPMVYEYTCLSQDSKMASITRETVGHR